jgi:hypothetical protein
LASCFERPWADAAMKSFQGGFLSFLLLDKLRGGAIDKIRGQLFGQII